MARRKTESTQPTDPCRVCGRALPPQKGRGRRREYHPECKVLEDHLAAVERSTQYIQWNTPADRQALRSRLFSLANLA